MNKKFITVAKIILGLLFFIPGTLKLSGPFASFSYLYGGGESFMVAVHNTGYLFHLLAIAEILGGLLLLTNLYVPLALTILAPVTLNIILFHLFLDTTIKGVIVSAVVLTLQLMLVFSYKEIFKLFFIKN